MPDASKKSRVTLTLSRRAMEAGRRAAAAEGKSFSRYVEEMIEGNKVPLDQEDGPPADVEKPAKRQRPKMMPIPQTWEELGPATQWMTGQLAGHNYEELMEDYRRYLEEKYR